MSHNAEERRPEQITRIDQPHRPDFDSLPHGLRGAPAEIAVAAGSTLTDGAEQVRLHAEQLAGHLRSRLRDIDGREAHLNARIAELENELRTARLWIAEREHELASRDEELRRGQSELEQRLRALAIEESSTAERHGLQEESLRARTEELADRERRLSLGLSQLAEEAETLRIARDQFRAVEAESSRRARENAGGEWAQRQQELQRVADELEARKAQIDQEQNEVTQLRSAAERECEQQRERLQQRETALERHWTRAQQTLAARRQRLDRREAALEQLHADTVRIHRETLEMRLLLEELWSQIGDQVSPDEVTKTVCQLRLRLADHFRLARQELEEEKLALRNLGARLDAKHADIRQQRTALQTWLERREQQLEEQAERLLAREAGIVPCQG